MPVSLLTVKHGHCAATSPYALWLVGSVYLFLNIISMINARIFLVNRFLHLLRRPADRNVIFPDEQILWNPEHPVSLKQFLMSCKISWHGHYKAQVNVATKHLYQSPPTNICGSLIRFELLANCVHVRNVSYFQLPFRNFAAVSSSSRSLFPTGNIIGKL